MVWTYIKHTYTACISFWRFSIMHARGLAFGGPWGGKLRSLAPVFATRLQHSNCRACQCQGGMQVSHPRQDSGLAPCCFYHASCMVSHRGGVCQNRVYPPCEAVLRLPLRKIPHMYRVHTARAKPVYLCSYAGLAAHAKGEVLHGEPRPCDPAGREQQQVQVRQVRLGQALERGGDAPALRKQQAVQTGAWLHLSAQCPCPALLDLFWR